MSVPIWILILAAAAGAVLYLAADVIIRRFDASIRSREDYESDVDGKMTEEEKHQEAEQKKEEAEKKKIGIAGTRRENPVRFWIVIVAGAVLSVLPFLAFGVNAQAILDVLFFWFLVMIALIDYDTTEIPPALNLGILILGIAAAFLVPEVTILERLIGAVSISLFLILINLIRADAFGYGDIKMLFASGFFLGWKANVTGFFLGTIVGAIVGVALLAGKKKEGKDHIPFGPSLCTGLAAASLFGTDLINWYIEILKMAKMR